MTKQEVTDKIESIKKNTALPEKQKAQLLKVYEEKLASFKEEPKKEVPAKKTEANAKPAAKKAAKAKVPAKKAETKPATKGKKNCEELIEREEKAAAQGYDVDELIKTTKERRAKAKLAAAAKAEAPKKTEATKNKEVVEKATNKVVTNVAKRVEDDDVSESEIEKLIAEYEEAIKKLKAVLARIKAKK